MKKITFLSILLIFIQFNTLCQIDFSNSFYFETRNNQFFHYPGQKYYYDKDIIKSNISNKVSTKTTYISKKGRKIKCETTTFNKKGLLISFSSEKRKVLNVWKNDTLLLTRSIFKNNDSSRIEYQYNDNNKCIGYKNFRGNKLKFECQIQYDEAGNEISRKNLYGKHLKNSSEMKYFYNLQKKKIKTEHYINNKLISTWNYDCSDKGDLSKTNEISRSSTCKWNEDFNDGSYIIYSRTLNRNSSFLDKHYYTKDSVLLKSERYESDSILTSSFIIEKGFSQQIHFKKNNKINYSNITFRNDKKQIINEHRTYYHILSTQIYSDHISYDSKNLITQIEKWQNNKLKSKQSFEYTYYTE